MRTVPFPLVGGSYADETKPWSMQDTVNLLPVMAEKQGTRSQAMLKTPPGLFPYLEIPGSAKAIRGTYNAEGKFFAVAGNTLYQIKSPTLAEAIGPVPGLGRVSFTHNQISLGNEVVVVNGSAGYVYDTVTGAFGRITDPGYPGSAVAGFIDGYVLGIEPQGRYAFNSRPAAATQYNTLDRFTSEVSPDRLVTQAISNNELLLLSASTGEFFENTGAAQQPFRSKRITFDVGCAGAFAITNLDNTIVWLANDGFFYRLDGYTPRRISTRPIEQAIRGLNWSQAFGFTWKDSGHEIAYFTFPDGRTWGWDAANGYEPARRESYELLRWRVNSLTQWNKQWYAGDFQTGRIWRLDWNYMLEGDQEFVSERTCVVMHDDQNLVRAPRLELVMATGAEETQPQSFPSWVPGISPCDIETTTLYISSTDSDLWNSAGNDPSPVVTDGAQVRRVDACCGFPVAMAYDQATGITLRTNEIAGRAVLDFVNTQLVSYKKPIGNGGVAFTTPTSNYIDPDNATVIWSGRILAAPEDQGPNINNPALFRDAHVVIGLCYFAVGSVLTLRAYHNDGEEKEISRNMTLGEPFVATFRHVDGKIRLRINGGTWAETASGSSELLNQQFHLPNADLGGNNHVQLMDACVCGALSDAQVSAIEARFSYHLGLF